MTSNSLFKLLLNLSHDQYSDELEDCKWFAAIVSSGVDDGIYLNSEVFWWHCKQLRLDPSFVIKIINKYKNIERG